MSTFDETERVEKKPSIGMEANESDEIIQEPKSEFEILIEMGIEGATKFLRQNDLTEGLENPQNSKMAFTLTKKAYKNQKSK